MYRRKGSCRNVDAWQSRSQVEGVRHEQRHANVWYSHQEGLAILSFYTRQHLFETNKEKLLTCLDIWTNPQPYLKMLILSKIDRPNGAR